MCRLRTVISPLVKNDLDDSAPNEHSNSYINCQLVDSIAIKIECRSIGTQPEKPGEESKSVTCPIPPEIKSSNLGEYRIDIVNKRTQLELNPSYLKLSLNLLRQILLICVVFSA